MCYAIKKGNDAMYGGLGILIILVMIIRHVGACIRETIEVNEDRQRAIADGEDFFCTRGGTRDTATNNKIIVWTDQYFGLVGQDLYDENLSPITRGIDPFKDKLYYYGYKRLLKKYKETYDKTDSEDSTMWSESLGNNRVYIDKETGQICFKVMANFPSGKGITYFYVDFLTRTKAIKKTEKQLLEEKRNKNYDYYSMDELNELVSSKENYKKQNLELCWFEIYH